mgnify:CR=1 FL=1
MRGKLQSSPQGPRRRLGDREYRSCHKITEENSTPFERVKIACPVGLERRARVVLKCRVESDKPGRSFTENRTVKSRFQRVTEVTAVSALAPEGRGVERWSSVVPVEGSEL